jgi:DNA polymerase zeta
MYFQVVSVAHSLGRPQEELGDVLLSPVFRRVSARCPVLHLFGYVHLPLVGSSPQAPAAARREGRSGSRSWHSDAVPLATLLEPEAKGTTPSSNPPPLASAGDSARRTTVISPSPKPTSRSVHVVESLENHERGQGDAHPSSAPGNSCASVNGAGASEETCRSSTMLRARYTQRRACLHVHGAYPSFLLPQYDRSVSPEQLAAQLETVVVRVLSRQGVVIPGQQLVHDVRVVHRYSVYGYRPHTYAFYLVELIDPAMQQRVVDVLQNTQEVGGRQWQLYDAHLKYHTQFMVHHRINGVAPFSLPVSRCHVRLPTAVELRCHHQQLLPFLDSPAGSHRERGGGGRRSGRHKASLKTEMEEAKTTSRGNISGSAGGASLGKEFSFLRVWRPDELGRLTTAEVEMDVAARDLCEPPESNLSSCNADRLTGSLWNSDAATVVSHNGWTSHLTASHRLRVAAGDNLSYTRRMICQYFKEHGVSDALRVADTIAMERCMQAKSALTPITAAAGGRSKDNAALQNVLLRYGSVTQIQRADPTVRWMRHRMLEYLEQRRVALPPATATSTATAAPRLCARQMLTAVGEGADVEARLGETREPAPSQASSRLPPTVPFDGVVVSASTTAEQQREQRVMRAQLIAEYSKHNRYSRGTTVQTDSGGRVVVPAPLPTFAEMADKNKHPLGHSAAAERASGDAVYVGFSSDSLQLSPSQEAWKAADVKVEDSASAVNNASQVWLRDVQVDAVREAEATSTQDLMAALVARSSASLEVRQETAEPEAISQPHPALQDTKSTNEEPPAEGECVAEADTGGDGGEHRTSTAVTLPARDAPSRTAAAAGLASDAAPRKEAASLESSWSSWSSWSSNSSLSTTKEDVVKAINTGSKRRAAPRKAAKADRRPAVLCTSVGANSGGAIPSTTTTPSNPLTSCPVNGDVMVQEAGEVRQHDDFSTPGLRYPLWRLSDALPNAGARGLTNVACPSTSLFAAGNARTVTDSIPDQHHREERDGGGRTTLNRKRTRDTTHSLLRLSAPLQDESHNCSDMHGYRVGDCVAFVQVDETTPTLTPPPSQQHPSSSFSAVPRADTITQCDVLAIARLARIDGDTVDLQWLIQLNETHLAGEEGALVRRGAWMRFTHHAKARQVSRKGGGKGSAECPVLLLLLGEMLLSDVVDTVPASVLAGVPHSAFAYAAAHSAPTQRLPIEPPTRSSPQNAAICETLGVNRGDQRVVHMWPVQCCSDADTYRSVLDGDGDAGQQQHESQLTCGFPSLRILCRYQYVMEARVLTTLPHGCFISVSEDDGQRYRGRGIKGPPLYTVRSADVPSGFQVAVVHSEMLRSAAGAPEEEVMGRALRSSSAPAFRSQRRSAAHRRASRVLFTQPEVLSCTNGADEASDETEEEGVATDLPNPRPTNTNTTTDPFLISVDGGSAVHAPVVEEKNGSSEKSGGRHAAVPNRNVAEAEEGEGEDTLLFSSSSSNDSDDDGGSAPNTRPGVLESRRRLHFSLLGGAATSSELSAEDRGQPTNATQRSHGTAEGSAARTPYCVSTLRMPVQQVVFGALCIPRSVPVAPGVATECLPTQEQQRLLQRAHDTGTWEDGEGLSQKAMSEDVRRSDASLSPARRLHGEAERERVPALSYTETPLRVNNLSQNACPKEGLSTHQLYVEGDGVAEGEVLLGLLPQPSAPVHHTVRDSGVSRFSSAMSDSDVPLSEAPSVEAVGMVTASQRAFLKLFHSAETDEGDVSARGGVRGTVLQTGGALGATLDGVPRWFSVTACGSSTDKGTGLRRRASTHSPQPGVLGDERRLRVSAVTWPYIAPPTMSGSTPSSLSAEHLEYVRLEETATPSAITVAAPAETPKAPAAPAGTTNALPSPASAAREAKSASHVPGLSLSVTQQPQHYLQCVLRVQYIEVLLNRRPGEKLVSTSDVLAVALGQATTAADSTIGVRVFCVASPAPRKDTRPVTRTDGGKKAHDTVAPGAAAPLPELRLHGLCSPVQVVTVADEAELLTCVRDELLAYDADVLLSWEGYKYGLGYLALRYRAVLQRSLASDLSRMLLHHGYPPKAKPPHPSPHVERQGKAAPSAAGVVSGGVQQAVINAGDLARLRAAEGRCTGTTDAARTTMNPVAEVVSGPPLFPSPPPPPVPQCVVSSSSSVSSAVLCDVEEDVADGDYDNGDDDDEVSGTGGAPNDTFTAHSGGWRQRKERGKRNQPPQEQQQQPYAARCGGAGTTAAASTTREATAATAAVASYSKRFGANVHINGRICTSLGTSLRKDIKMPSYALPMVHAQLFGQPLPYFTDTYLADLFHSTHDPGERVAALRYLAARVAAPHRIARALRWFTKLLEFSRMYGILVEEVLTRGSQFRVEATLLRLAHPLKYAMLSPSLLQVHRQPRIECIPLVLQPKANFYKREDPVVVLDFRSLYPSIIIAYNLCYTTCLGMVQPTAHGRLGVLANYTQRDSLLAELLPDDGVQHDGVVFTPNGAMFVGPSTRVGLLPQMVQAVLDTRFEVQASLRHIAEPMADTMMQERLQEQQLALKMLANVTYGYTAASYTGRMPCVDLAEAIVSLGRQTLERAIALIHSTAAWRAEVVYGDTDSLFVRLHGRTLQEAFLIGQEMAAAVTQSNPTPIRLQLEKVLSPCLLLVKKRYAGYMWTSPTQTAPTFLAKGIEVVRRDQCPATTQLVRKMLTLLFDGATAATLRHVYYSEMEKMQSGTVNPVRCVFRRAVKLGRYGRSGDGHLPLAARLALKQIEVDVTETPYWGELLPYVVVRSTHSIDHLTDQVLHPAQLLYLHDRHSLDASYYITRNINSSLDRMFYLVGISFAQWYQAMPRRRTAHAALLNLPTFMKAQEQPGQSARTEGGSQPASVPPPPSPAPGSRCAGQQLRGEGGGGTHSLPRDAADDEATGVRLCRVTQLAAEMQQLLHDTSGPLMLHRQNARLLSHMEEEVISDDEAAEAGEEANTHARLSLPQPVDVEDLTRPTVHEFIDVEQLMATQRGCLSAATGGASCTLPPRPPPPSRSPVRGKGRGGGGGARRGTGGVTLDTLYPRTLCVVCEKEAVSLDDVRRQRAVLQRFDRTLGATVDVVDYNEGTCADQTHKEAATHAEVSGATAPPSSSLPSASSMRLLLPPICTRCWSDPFVLYLHVQQRCRSFGQQLHTLQRICACCIGSGGDWGPAAQAVYQSATLDMEDMDVFASAKMREERSSGVTQACAVGSVPLHLATAVELSARGVPQGCVSVDCAVGFEKKWLTEQWQQWKALQQFLRSVM